MTTERTTIVLRCSGDARDVALASDLRRQLRLPELHLGVEVSSDGDVALGTDRRQELEAILARANIVLLLLSADFYFNDRFQEFERPILMDRQKSGTLLVLPIALRACAWEQDPWISGLRPLPRPHGRPAIGSCSDRERDDVLKSVVLDVSRRIAIRCGTTPQTAEQRRLADESLALFRGTDAAPPNEPDQTEAVTRFLERCLAHLAEEYGHDLRFAPGPQSVFIDRYTPLLHRSFYVHLVASGEYPRSIRVWYGAVGPSYGFGFATGDDFTNGITVDFSDACVDKAAQMIWKVFQSKPRHTR